MLDKFVQQWRGIALAAIGVTACGWLAVNGRLGLYVHPRYIVFTVVMTAVAAGLCIAACGFASGAAHDHDDTSGPTSRSAWLSLVVVVLAAVAALGVPPSTLTADTAQEREVNASVVLVHDDPHAVLKGTDYASFGVKDWAQILGMNLGRDFYLDREADVTGFVLPFPEHRDLFYVARFVVTCCAVDARPVGVPVRLPGWRSQHPPDTWVRVEGRFTSHPSGRIVLDPTTSRTVPEPDQPYEY